MNGLYRSFHIEKSSSMFWGYLALEFTYTFFHTKTYIFDKYQCDF